MDPTRADGRLRLRIEHFSGVVRLCCTLSGHIDFALCKHLLHEVLMTSGREQVRQLHIDLREVEDIQSCVLGTLLHLQEALGLSKDDMSILCRQGAVWTLLDSVGLKKRFTLLV